MTALLPLAILLFLVLLPRLLPRPAPAGAMASELPEPPTGLLANTPAEPPPGSQAEAHPAPLRAARPDNLLYLPLGLHPADRNLHGAVEVSGLLRIRPPLRFWSLSANEIRFGDCSRAPQGVAAVRAVERRVEGGEFRVAAGTCVNGDLQVHGDLYLGRYSTVRGSVQVEGGVWMDEGAEVAGAIVARGSVRVGRRSRVAGPLMVGRNLSLARECVIGAPLVPTRVSANSLRIVEGCRVHGRISAEGGAQVKALVRLEDQLEQL